MSNICFITPSPRAVYCFCCTWSSRRFSRPSVEPNSMIESFFESRSKAAHPGLCSNKTRKRPELCLSHLDTAALVRDRADAAALCDIARPARVLVLQPGQNRRVNCHQTVRKPSQLSFRGTKCPMITSARFQKRPLPSSDYTKYRCISKGLPG